MSIKKFIVLLLIIVSNTIVAQQSLNEYKYMVVPKKYDFLKSEDQYQLNSLTKFLFKKEGFTTLLDSDSKPQELAVNACLGLTAKVNNNSNMFLTKLVIELANCKNEIIHTSIEGKSKQKDYKKAYQEALRNAFKSIELLDYKYNPVKITVAAKTEEVVVEEKPTAIVKEAIADEIETVAEEVPFKVIEDVTPVATEVIDPKKGIINTVGKEEEKIINLLYAQENDLGYQLVDSKPKVVYVLLKSSQKDLYFLKNKNGIVFKQNNKWFAEFYNENKLIKHELDIKF